jgi:hypothetical protein
MAKIVREVVDKAAHLMTDESVIYKVVGREFASHRRVKHYLGQYVKYTDSGDQITTNRIEAFGRASRARSAARAIPSHASTCTAMRAKRSSSTTRAVCRTVSGR